MIDYDCTYSVHFYFFLFSGNSNDLPVKSNQANGIQGKGKAPASGMKPALVKKSAKPEHNTEDQTDGSGDTERKTLVDKDTDKSVKVEEEETDLKSARSEENIDKLAGQQKGQGESVA